jgi:hypothetical protein
MVSNDWAPTPLRPHLDDLSAKNPDGFRRLTEQLGNPPEGLLVATATSAPPPWLRDADEATWELLARIAEATGEWLAAARAWEYVGRMRSGAAAAGPLVRAAVAAQAGGDNAEHDRLLDAASVADERNPRLVLARWDEDMPLPDQLVLLDSLHSDDPEELGLIAARRTLVNILLTDTPTAREALAEARRCLPGSAVVDGLDVSIAVQEGRLAVLDHRALDRGALRAAAEKAVKVRERLQHQRRFSESTRLVMLHADIHALLGERETAATILRAATDDEQATQEQKEVLADSAASRALDCGLALKFLDGAAETPTTLRIQLDCLEETGTPAERHAALDGLDRIVSARGPQAPEAAFHRLAATLGRIPTPWSEAAAAYLRSSGHERAAVTAEALYRVQEGGWEPVEILLRPYGQTPWALAAGLRAALHQRVDPHVAVACARAVLAIGPSHALRVDAARGLLRGGEVVAAHETLVAVARDPNGPDAVRSDAYDLLMGVVGRQLGEWQAAGDLHDEWVKLRPADTRAQRWAPTIANRRRRDAH